MSNITPLLRFLRCMTKEQRAAFAAAVGTKVVYLYQLAGSTAPNPQLRLAHNIVVESKRLGKKIMAYPLDYPDLLVGVTPDEDDPPT